MNDFQPVQTTVPFDVPIAAYIHIPFCRRRCFYCDFPISVVGDKPPTGEAFGAIAEYLPNLCTEIRSTPPQGQVLQTVFFGGGTPSLLTAAQLRQILETLQDHLGIAADAEISMEIDPGTFTLAQLKGYRAAGINRVSLGAQAFQANILQACGRTHCPEDILAAVDLIHQVNLPNYSLDLISGLPHLTMNHWQDSLEKAIALSPTHLSVYDLTLEPGTSFDRWFQPGADPLPSEAATADMYRVAQQTLTAAGYEHYEISNYAQPGHACRHNQVYWENRSYYGFGMAAASYIAGQRFTRPRKRREYFEWVKELQDRGMGAIACPPVTLEERLLDTLMLGLRLSQGLHLETLTQTFGTTVISQVLETLQPYIQKGWVAPPSQHSPRLKLQDPEGFLFSNVILSTLFSESATA
ncbi:MAG: radical SAM family heme chaperone HemW [Oculatellaceae cyanobacterium Prado106]|jgi:oxygen-independent coproporphyrinogen-3 oxidase|nr:radical SAM family heme chaperone HemW [Oculatellaceae cyanobacterium Prado106]